MLRLRVAGFALLLAVRGASSALPLRAQTVDSVLARQVERTSLVRLRSEGAVVTGRLIAIGSGVATLETETGRRAVSLSGVDTAWVRGRAAGTGAMIGGIAGAVGVGIFTAVVVHALCETDDCETVGAGFVGGLIGGAGGALLGAGIGALIPKWKRRWP
ncbi:MAG TPA: hypothetical protein VF862_06610 [Gemmatimonadales bacterium]